MTINFAFAKLEHPDLGSIKLHYAYAGKASPDELNQGETKPLLLCLHGFPEFNRVWHQQLKDLSDKFFVVAPDLRGYNLSDKPPGVSPYRVEELVEDAMKLVTHLGYDTFTLVGHDWGGLVSWTLASLYPGSLQQLIIINSPHPRLFRRLLANNRRQIIASQYISKFQKESAFNNLTRNNYDLLWRFGFKELVEKGVFNEEDKQAHIEAWSHDNAVESMLGSYRSERFEIPEVDAALPVENNEKAALANVINVPTLVIWGMDDTALTSECLNGLDEFVPDLKVLEVPGAGHGVIHERPHLISQTIASFTANSN